MRLSIINLPTLSLYLTMIFFILLLLTGKGKDSLNTKERNINKLIYLALFILKT